MLKKLQLILINILLAVALSEGALQIGALLVQSRTGGELPSTWITGNLRILCLGDSNTYGVTVPRDKPYPQQLETLWNRTFEPPKVEVLNLGFPGTNSSRLVRDMPRLLETFRPDVTILMVGVNDFWTVPFPIEDASHPRAGFLERHSKLYRLYYLIRRRFAANEVEILLDLEGNVAVGAQHRARFGDQEFEMGFKKIEGVRGNADSLRSNLRTLVEQASAGETRLYLMSYPARYKFYRTTNPIIWAVAETTGARLINLTEIFEPLCPEESCPEYLLADDHHPNVLGYQVIAEMLALRLSEDLR